MLTVAVKLIQAESSVVAAGSEDAKKRSEHITFLMNAPSIDALAFRVVRNRLHGLSWLSDPSPVTLLCTHAPTCKAPAAQGALHIRRTSWTRKTAICWPAALCQPLPWPRFRCEVI
jgi:hypothetical protein